MTSPEEAAAALIGAQMDPVGWMERVLGFRPWRVQREIAESVRDNRRSTVRSCHGIGKTKIAAAIGWWFVSTHPRSIVITTATTHRQVRGLLWKEFHALARDARMPLGGRLSDVRFEFDDDWWAWGFTGDEYDPTKFQGFHAEHVLVIVDEAAGVSTEVFEGLESALSSGHTRALWIGNPTEPDGEFARSFDRKMYSRFVIDAFATPNFVETGVTIDDIRTTTERDGSTTGEWRKKVDAYIAKFGALPLPLLISPEWVAEQWLKWCGGRVEGEVDPRWCSRVRAQFPSSAPNAMFPSEWVSAAMDRHGTVEWRKPRPFRLGCDVARFGGDTTQIAAYFTGAGVREVFEEPPLDTMATADAIHQRAYEEQDRGHKVEEVGVRIDADGLGAGIYDRALQLLGDGYVIGIRNGANAQDVERFENARSEIMWHLREAIDPKADSPIALPPDEDLAQELRAFRWKLGKRGRILAESKDEIKKRLGRSPDRADAVAYAVANVDVLGDSVEII